MATQYNDEKTKLLLELCKDRNNTELGQCKELLNNGADPNGHDEGGRTSLMWASEYGKKRVVELLLHHKANVNLSDKDGRTALHHASVNSHAHVVSALIEGGARTDEKDKSGKTPLDFAREYGNDEVVNLIETGNFTGGSDAKTIAFLFESRAIPFKDVVSSLAADKSLEWDSDGEGKTERKAKFRVKCAFDITLSCYNQPMTYLEIRMSKVGASALFLQDACVHVRETVEKKLVDIVAKDDYSLAFLCTCEQTSTQHMMKVEMHTQLPPRRAVCNYKPLYQNLSEGTHLDWFAPRYEAFDSDKKGLLTLNFTPVPNLQRKGEKVQFISANYKDVVSVDQSQPEATIKNRCFEGEPEKTVIEQSNEFVNMLEEPAKKTWNYRTSQSSGEERSKIKGRMWNIGGELKPTVSAGGVGVGLVGLSATYGRHSEQRHTTIHKKKNESLQTFEFDVPGKTTVIVRHLRISQKYKATVENVRISFNPKAKVKCKVLKESSGNEKETQYELRDVYYLNGEPIPDEKKEIQQSVSACYEWTKITTKVSVDKVEKPDSRS